MPITSSNTLDITPHAGRFRARFEFTLTDGRKIGRGPINLATASDADAKRTAMEPSILAGVQKSDASEAVGLGVYTAYKEATEAQVQYAWLIAGYEAEEHYLAYPLIKDLAPSLLSLGYTDEQYAAAFNTTVEEVQNIQQYWTFLDTNKTAIEAYALIAGEV